MARFSMGACPIASRISANAFMISLPIFLLLLSNSVAQPLGCSDPNVAALEVDAENVVVGRRGGDRDRRYGSLRIAHRHLRLAVFKRRAIDGPIYAVVVGQPLVGAEPGTLGIHALDSVGKVRGKSAIFRKKVVPVAAIVAAVAEVGGRPQDVVHVSDVCG